MVAVEIYRHLSLLGGFEMLNRQINTDPEAEMRRRIEDGIDTGDPVKKTQVFQDAAGQGAVGTVNLFTVTGTVRVKLLAVCEVNLAGATATLEVGISGATASIIAQTTGTDIVAGEIWHDATPDADIEAATVMADVIIVGGADIIATVGTAALTAGQITFYAWVKEISTGAKVTAA